MAADASALTLQDDVACVEIHPELGGAIGRYDVRTPLGHLEIFRTDSRRPGVFRLGCNVLLPFSNRISGGGFSHGGVFHPLAPNIAGNPYPIHGNAFTRPWQVIVSRRDCVVLELDSDGPGPFRYHAELRYSLENGALRMHLRATNRAAIALPFGMGFHPWFVRTRSTRLAFQAAGFWSENGEHLPDAFHAAGDVPGMDFAPGSALPGGWINNAFTGWKGTARIEWPDRRLAATVTSAPPLTTAIVYSPSADADFFCFEPVSHSVDAHNSTAPGTAPPQVLEPGQRLEGHALISPEILD